MNTMRTGTPTGGWFQVVEELHDPAAPLPWEEERLSDENREKLGGGLQAAPAPPAEPRPCTLWHCGSVPCTS